MPVFNPGRYLEPAIASVLAQSLPAGQVEAIFVDDGSTDGTAARLDDLAAEHPATIRVIHIPASGAPGRPRNVGLDAARGDYVQFLDADDELTPDALERAVATADRHRSDVVIEKFASATIRRPQRLFDRNVERATLAEKPWLVEGSLALAKLFRRSFLGEHSIAFPEGWRLMEDAYVVLHAFLRAQAISVLADHVCYYFRHRDDGGHLTSAAIDPDRHVAHLAQLLDMVEAETQPGPLRERIIRRMLRVEILARAVESTAPDVPAADRDRMVEAFGVLLRTRIDPAVIAGFGGVRRVQDELLREGRSDGLMLLGDRLRDLEAVATFEGLHWHKSELQFALDARLAFGDRHRPMTITRAGSQAWLDRTVADEVVGHRVEVGEEVDRYRLDVLLREPTTNLEWVVTTSAGDAAARRAGPATAPMVEDAPDGDAALRAEGDASLELDDGRAAGFRLTAGSWGVLAAFSTMGIERIAPLRPVDEQRFAAPEPALLGRPTVVIVPTLDAAGLRIEVDPPPSALAEALAGRSSRLIRDGRRVIVELDMVAGSLATSVPAALVAQLEDRELVLPARLRPLRDRVVVDARVSSTAGLARDPRPLALRLVGPHETADVALGMVQRDGAVRLRVSGLERQSRRRAIAAAVPWHVARFAAASRAVVAGARRSAGRVKRAALGRGPARAGR